MISRTVLWILIGEIVVGFAALTIVVTVLYFKYLTEIETQKFSPTETAEVLANPLTGWCPWGDLVKPMPQPFGTFFMSFTWKELEPIKREYQWDALEEKFQFQRWRLGHKRFILRVVLDKPEEYKHTDLPTWLLQSGCQDGTFYNVSGYGLGYNPNYSNSILIAEHEILIQEIANHYKDDPMLVGVQIGSIGYNGEWTTVPFEFPISNISALYIDHYVKAFPKTVLQLPYPFNDEAKIGMYINNFGDEEKVNNYTNTINSGSYIDEYGAINPKFYETAPSSGNFYSTNYSWFFNDSSVADVLSQAEALHLTYIGPNCPADEFLDSPYQEDYDALINTIGYRFVIKEIEYASSVAYGDELEIKLVVKNVGIAPFYLDWPLEVALSLNGRARYSVISSEYPRNWGVGPRTIEFAVTIPTNVPVRKYDLCVAIVDSTGAPSIKFANNERPQSDGRYCFGKIAVVAPGLSRWTIIFIGGGIGLFTVLTAAITWCVGRKRGSTESTKVTPSETTRGKNETNAKVAIPLESPGATPDKRSVAELNTETGESRSTIVSKMIKPKKLQVIN